MRIEMVKHPGGMFVPAFDHEAARLERFKSGGQYTVELKLTRNPDFHRKVFAFFNFCFEHWCADKAELEHMDQSAQFDTFRKHLTVLAGYRDVTYTIDGRARVEAKSLAYGNMEQEDFERCYNALIKAAIKHIFAGTDDQDVWNQLQGFF